MSCILLSLYLWRSKKWSICKTLFLAKCSVIKDNIRGLASKFISGNWAEIWLWEPKGFFVCLFCFLLFCLVFRNKVEKYHFKVCTASSTLSQYTRNKFHSFQVGNTCSLGESLRYTNSVTIITALSIWRINFSKFFLLFH